MKNSLMPDEFVKVVNDMRHQIIESGGRPTTLKISKQEIEKCKLFGMDIEIVESDHLPENVAFLVYDERNIKR